MQATRLSQLRISSKFKRLSSTSSMGDWVRLKKGCSRKIKSWGRFNSNKHRWWWTRSINRVRLRWPLRKSWRTISIQGWEWSGPLSAKLSKLSMRSARVFLTRSKTLCWMLRLTHYMREILKPLTLSFKIKTTGLTRSTKTSSKCCLQSSEQTSTLMISSLSLRNLAISSTRALWSQASCLSSTKAFLYSTRASLSTATRSTTRWLL